jgi:hypothetical protein
MHRQKIFCEKPNLNLSILSILSNLFLSPFGFDSYFNCKKLVRQDLQDEQATDILRKAKPKPVNPVDPV